jgi:hypothetical protein
MELAYSALIISGIAALFSGMSLLVLYRNHKKQEKIAITQRTTDILFRIHKIRWFFYELSEAHLKEEEKGKEENRIIFNELASLLDFMSKNPNLDESKVRIKLTTKFLKDFSRVFDMLYEKIEELAPKSNAVELESLLPELNVIEHSMPRIRKLVQKNDP